MIKPLVDNIEIANLITKKMKGGLTDEESIQLNSWLEEQNANKEIYSRILEGDGFAEGIDLISEFDLENSWNQIEPKIKDSKSFNYKRYFKYAAAASVLFLIALTTYIVNPFEKTEITAGTPKAVLTTVNGEDVVLEKEKKYSDQFVSSSNGTLKYDEIPAVSSKNAVNYNYLTIPRGGEFTLVLSDGTKVWLNSDTKIKYPIQFKRGAPRNVELLYGEAYFDVVSAEDFNGSSFSVQSNGQRLKVLGTEFNIKSYPEDLATKTTLVEGSVVVSIAGEQVELTPDSQLIWDKETESFKVIELNSIAETSWKQGVFNFNHLPLEEVLKVVSRWYDVNVEFEHQETKKIQFNGVFKKDQKIDNILETITKSINTAYEIKEDKIIIK
ncbi:FecR family protein [Zhouia amylolytica]|uniref:FecR family protein n=1 Tax=Zhouia amylolytica TaxID=376730 RepID=UPI0020CC45B2|nr:FecR family protein [Zhouia amylolytica]MCQ0111896.1 DUF4974 domain-containing protein [Zhouia amylolytica]